MICIVCGKETSLHEGYWQRWDYKRRWVCRGCENSGRYTKEREDNGQMRWRHNRADETCLPHTGYNQGRLLADRV